MSKRFSTLLGILFLFVFTFTLVVTTASDLEAAGCCPIINFCPNEPWVTAWGKFTEGVGCNFELPLPSCAFVPICIK